MRTLRFPRPLPAASLAWAQAVTLKVVLFLLKSIQCLRFLFFIETYFQGIIYCMSLKGGFTSDRGQPDETTMADDPQDAGSTEAQWGTPIASR
jgi:hypothetical protein